MPSYPSSHYDLPATYLVLSVNQHTGQVHDPRVYALIHYGQDALPSLTASQALHHLTPDEQLTRIQRAALTSGLPSYDTNRAFNPLTRRWVRT